MSVIVLLIFVCIHVAAICFGGLLVCALVLEAIRAEKGRR